MTAVAIMATPNGRTRRANENIVLASTQNEHQKEANLNYKQWYAYPFEMAFGISVSVKVIQTRQNQTVFYV